MATNNIDSQLVKDSYPNLMNDYSEALAICTLPVFYLKGENAAAQTGTGFLVGTKSNDYLISAAHVFEPHEEGKELFFFIGDKKIRRLNGKLRRCADPFDIGVLQLSNEHRPPYTYVNKRSLKITSLAPGFLPRQDKQYLVTGFPASRTKLDWRSKHAVSELRPFLSSSLSHEQYERHGVDPQEHLLLDYEQKNFFNIGNGQQVTYPNPHGISGSPVWLTIDRKNANDTTRTPLVGVVTEYDPMKRFIKVCDIGFALALISEFENRNPLLQPFLGWP